jgi:3-isopropylmalate dehydrogenase
MQKFIELKGIAAPLLQPNIDTEVIIRIDRLIAHEAGALGPYCFESLASHPDGSPNANFPLNQPRFRDAKILLGGENFGCGSSREAAVWALWDRGIRCVVAPSFGDIFYENCLQNGLLPARLPRGAVETLAREIGSAREPVLQVDLTEQSIVSPSGNRLHFEIDGRRRAALLSGRDEIDDTLQHEARIVAQRARHRHDHPWAYQKIMPQGPKILLMAGDGIGPEIMAQARRVATWFKENRGLRYELRDVPYGIDSYKANGAVLSEDGWREVREAQAIVFGASGSPEYDSIPVELWKPDNLLRMRLQLGLYANLRPVRVLDAAVEFSPLRPEIISGVDLVIVRELNGGLYFNEPRGIVKLPDGTRRAVNTMAYSTPEIERIARVAFDLARTRRGRVCSVDKANVLETSELWREVVQQVHDRDYPDVVLDHMYVDNAAMQLVRAPGQFDVMVTENLFGDILSDAAAMVAGSIGMLPSASLGPPGTDGRPSRALYEPIHGSAPDIAGWNIANPVGTILSFAMCLRISLGALREAELLEAAVAAVVAAGTPPQDI